MPSSERKRAYFIELYPETESYDFPVVLQKLKVYFQKYAYISHDKDKNEDGEIKKIHIHFLGWATNGCTKEALSKRIGIPVNFIQSVVSIRSSFRYLIHLDDPDKYQYDKLDVVMSDDSWVKFWNIFKPSEGEKVLSLLEFVSRCHPSTLELVHFAVDNECYDALRRSWSILISCRSEIFR